MESTQHLKSNDWTGNAENDKSHPRFAANLGGPETVRGAPWPRFILSFVDLRTIQVSFWEAPTMFTIPTFGAGWSSSVKYLLACHYDYPSWSPHKSESIILVERCSGKSLVLELRLPWWQAWQQGKLGMAMATEQVIIASEVGVNEQSASDKISMGLLSIGSFCINNSVLGRIY